MHDLDDTGQLEKGAQHTAVDRRQVAVADQGRFKRQAGDDYSIEAITSTLESSGQLMMFVLPMLVLLGWPMGRYLHLSVPLIALGCTGFAVVAVHWITENNQLDWYEGIQLITLYGVIVLGTLLL